MMNYLRVCGPSTQHLIVLSLLVASTLGTINLNENWRSMGRSKAAEGEHPYQIYLQSLGVHVCSESIVDKERVIIAAHCVYGRSSSRLQIVAGTNKLSSSGIAYKVVEIHYHEDYDALNSQNDVAILKIEALTYTDVIGPIVVTNENVEGGVDVTLSGWGFEIPIADNLQEISLKTTTIEYCQRRHIIPHVIESQICTLAKSGGGVCLGDFGGLLTTTADGVKILVGVKSWGQTCEVLSYPDVFSRISSFYSSFQGKCGNCPSS